MEIMDTVIVSRHIQDKTENLCFEDMSQKLHTQSLAATRSRDEAGYIDDIEVDILDLDRSQVGNQGRKMIISDFDLSIGNRVDDTGLAHTRRTNQTYISEKL